MLGVSMFCRALSHGRHLSLLESLPVLAQHVQGSHSTAQRGYTVAKPVSMPSNNVFSDSHSIVNSAAAHKQIIDRITVSPMDGERFYELEASTRHSASMYPLNHGRACPAELFSSPGTATINVCVIVQRGVMGVKTTTWAILVSRIGTLRIIPLTVPRAKGQNFETMTL